MDTRWASTYQMLRRYSVLRPAINAYYQNLPDQKNSELSERLAQWELNARDHNHMEGLLKVLDVIAESQVMLEASDQPNYMLAGRCVLKLLYTSNELLDAEGPAFDFGVAFRSKLADCVDIPEVWLEWGVAAFLDPRQKHLGKYKIIWNNADIVWLERTQRHWSDYDAFVKEVRECVVQYAEDCMDPAELQAWHDQQGPRPVEKVGESGKKRSQHNFSDEEEEDMPAPRKVGKGRRVVGKSPIHAELEQYFTFTWDTYIKKEDSTPLDWWKLALGTLPLLGKLVRWSWSCQASSAASERQFSRAGFINNRRRQSQNPTTLWECSILASLDPDVLEHVQDADELPTQAVDVEHGQSLHG